MISRPVGVAAFITLTAPTCLAAQTGTVRGVIHVQGAPAALPALRVTIDRDVCGDSIPSRRLLIERGRVANAVIVLEGVPRTSPQPSGALLTNRNCDFDPPVQVAVVGGVLTLRNDDPVMHNVHLYHQRRTVGNISLPMRGVTLQNRRALARAGLVEVKCDAHEWMRAKIWVLDHPYYAVSAPDGTFDIGNVPPGAYTLSVWHEVLGEQSHTVVVEANRDVSVQVSFGR